MPGLPVGGRYDRVYNPSAAARHLPLHRGGFPEAVFKSIPCSPAPAGEKAVVRWPHLSVAWFLTQPMAAVRGRVIEEPTLRVVFCIVLRTISQHSCSGKKPQPWSAAAASKRRALFVSFSGTKRKESTARCRFFPLTGRRQKRPWRLRCGSWSGFPRCAVPGRARRSDPGPTSARWS